MVFPLDLILFLYPASSCIHLSECFLQITSAFTQQVPYSRKTLWKTTRSFSLPSQTWVWATTSCIARRSRTLWNLSSPTTPFRLCRKVSCPPTPTPPQWCFFSFFFFLLAGSPLSAGSISVLSRLVWQSGGMCDVCLSMSWLLWFLSGWDEHGNAVGEMMSHMGCDALVHRRPCVCDATCKSVAVVTGNK